MNGKRDPVRKQRSKENAWKQVKTKVQIKITVEFWKPTATTCTQSGPIFLKGATF